MYARSGISSSSRRPRPGRRPTRRPVWATRAGQRRAALQSEDHRFSSETDAEVVAHLVERHYAGDLADAVRAAYRELEGHFAFVVIHNDHPDLLVGARRQC